MLRIATDVGGTFTDLVYFEIDEKSGKALSIKTAKSDTTPSSYEKGVFDSINKSNVDISKSSFLSNSPDLQASSFPLGERSTSTQPVNLFSKFHSL